MQYILREATKASSQEEKKITFGSPSSKDLFGSELEGEEGTLDDPVYL